MIERIIESPSFPTCTDRLLEAPRSGRRLPEEQYLTNRSSSVHTFAISLAPPASVAAAVSAHTSRFFCGISIPPSVYLRLWPGPMIFLISTLKHSDSLHHPHHIFPPPVALMPTTPISELSRLSIGSSMSPPARQRGRASRTQQREDVSSSEESESDSSASEEEGEESPYIRSPSKLTYNIDGLDLEGQATARDAFGDPPQMTLQVCGQRGNVYAFQMTELVNQSIRISSPDSPSPSLQCSCGAASPCKHVLWLMDRLAKQTLYDQDPDVPLNLTPHGYPREMGHPFEDISRFHLDLLADSLHCELKNPEDSDSDSDDDDDDDGLRAREAHELLASVAAVAPEKFRSDLTKGNQRKKKALKRGDLECTVFRMLLKNNEFFKYFLSRTGAADVVNDPFRKLSQRANRILLKLDQYSASLQQSQTGTPTTASSASSQRQRRPKGPPCTVPWAAYHLLGIVARIRTHLTPDLPPPQRTSAARTLIRILSAVSDANKDAHPGPGSRDRNLYARLIAHNDDNFVLPLLFKILDAAAPFLHNLEVARGRIAAHGAPASYLSKFEELMDRLKEYPQARTSPVGGGSGAGSKRQGQGGQDRSSKRVK